jgi:hypothetical protein
VSAGGTCGLALGSDGNIYAWGDNTDGELGDGTITAHLSAEPIAPSGFGAALISAGDGFCLAFGSAPAVAPVFATASPPLTYAVGDGIDYTFSATGWPAPTYAPSAQSPAWLSIGPQSGTLTGVVPAGSGSFSYSVIATNAAGAATAGPFTVTIQQQGQPTTANGVINGVVVDTGNNPVPDVYVGAALNGVGIGSVTTGSTGEFNFDFTFSAGASIEISAYAVPSANLLPADTGNIPVPGNGVLELTISLNAISQISQFLNWGGSSEQSVTGCPNGLAAVTVVGRNMQTGTLSYDMLVLTETPAGSGTYSGLLPPQYPIHGPVDIETAVGCPPQSALVPSLGPAAGGNTVIVTGSGFTGAAGVSFGANAAQGFTVLSDLGIQVVAPAGSGSVPVTVYPGSEPATGTAAGQYTYVAITAITPASGPAAGGTWVIIAGTGLLSATSVRFGLNSAVQFITLSDTQIEALSPPGHAGTLDVTVGTLYGGTTPMTAADLFEYTSGAGGASLPTPPAAQLSRRPATVPARLQPNLSPAAGSGPSLATQVAQWINSNLPQWYGMYKQGKKASDLLQFGLNVDCGTSEQIAVDEIKLALKPEIEAEVAEITLEAQELAGTVFAELGPADLIIVQTLIPILVDYGVNWLYGQDIKALVKTLLGDCQKQDTGQPPQPPQPAPEPTPGGGSSGSGVGGGWGPVDSYAPNGLIDPSGTVLDSNGNPVSGATVTILRSDTEGGPFAAVSVSDPGILPATNPETTGSDGIFHWDVRAGYYQIQATAPGCTAPGDQAQPTATIGPYAVPPPQTGLAISMACQNEPTSPVPTVTGLTVNTGPPSGGTAVTVMGSGFTPSSGVTFGGTAAGALTFLSPQALAVVSPPGTGLVDVIVETAGVGSARSAPDQFFYGSPPAITAVNPQSGSAAGGVAVTVSGSGFTGATLIGFGGRPAGTFTVTSDTEIAVTSPPTPPGTADIVVVTPAGGSALTAADQYTSTTPPQFTAATPPVRIRAFETYTYAFAASGVPAPAYSLEPGAPSWLSINPGTGVVTGEIGPMEAGFHFSYTVMAANAAGSATAGPFTVTLAKDPVISE